MPETKTTRHGVFLKIFNYGVLLTGPANSGKSETALELVRQGHCLIADDIIDFSSNNHSEIVGQCPRLLQDLIAIRDLGILNLRVMFGDQAICRAHKLDLIIELGAVGNKNSGDNRILAQPQNKQSLAGIKIDSIRLNRDMRRNLPLMIETLLQNRALIEQGYNAQQDFINSQTKLCDTENP